MSPRIPFPRTFVKRIYKGPDTPVQSQEVDEIDRQILRTLMAEPRLSYREISRRSKLSTSTVIERLRKLKMNNVIGDTRLHLDAKKLGYDITAVAEINVNQGAEVNVAKELSKLKNVHVVYDMVGSYDVLVVAKFKKSEELNRFIKTLQKTHYVSKTVTHVVLEPFKEDFRISV
jgi:DNA-binding Lrp family transcriptional regulator